MIFFVALRKELLEQWRTYRLLVVAAVLAAFGLSSPLMARFTPELLKMLPQGEQIALMIPPPTVEQAVGQYLENVSQFAVILALLMTMGAVAVEKDKGTAALMLVKPLPRPVFLAAKFVALALTFLAGLVIAGASAYYYTLLLFEPPDVGKWLALNGLLFVYVLVYVAITLLCSTVSRSQIAAAGLAFIGLILLGIGGGIPRVGDFLPGKLLGWGMTMFMPPGAPQMSIEIPSTGGEPAWAALWGSIGLIVAALVAAWAVFRRQEL